MDHAVLRETLDTGELIYWGMAAREKEHHKAGRNEREDRLNRSLIQLPLRGLIRQLVSEGFDCDDRIVE